MELFQGLYSKNIISIRILKCPKRYISIKCLSLKKCDIHIVCSKQMIKYPSKDIRNIQHPKQNLNNGVYSSVNHGTVSR